MAEGTIRLLLLNSGEMLMARLRSTTDPDGQLAYQLIRPRRVEQLDVAEQPWRLRPYLQGVTTVQLGAVQARAGIRSGARWSPVRPMPKKQFRNVLRGNPVERLKRAFRNSLIHWMPEWL